MLQTKEYMSIDKIDNFIEWLDEQEKKRGWTDYRLAKEAGVNPSVLSKARSGTMPKWDACVAISQALRISPTTVFRAAGLLPPEGSDQMRLADWEHLLSQLDPSEQEEIYQILELKVERRKQAEQAAAAKNMRTGRIKA